MINQSDLYSLPQEDFSDQRWDRSRYSQGRFGTESTSIVPPSVPSRIWIRLVKGIPKQQLQLSYFV